MMSGAQTVIEEKQLRKEGGGSLLRSALESRDGVTPTQVRSLLIPLESTARVAGNRCRIPGVCNSTGFEPSTLRHFFADVAQLVERNLAKVEVTGSNPVICSTRQ